VNVVKRSARVISESASRPPSGFWCLNDRMIKELMNFAKCEKCLVIILKLFVHQDICCDQFNYTS
jgi:hypothetical protein